MESIFVDFVLFNDYALQDRIQNEETARVLKGKDRSNSSRDSNLPSAKIRLVFPAN